MNKNTYTPMENLYCFAHDSGCEQCIKQCAACSKVQPPQQKQDDEDLLESLTKLLLPQIGTYPNTLTVGIATDCAKTILKHYNLTKK